VFIALPLCVFIGGGRTGPADQWSTVPRHSCSLLCRQRWSMVGQSWCYTHPSTADSFWWCKNIFT